MIFNRDDNKIMLWNDEGINVGEIEFAYRNTKTIIALHTFVDNEYRGQGYAKMLLNKLVEFARENDLKIIARCHYVVREFDEDSSYEDVIFKEDDGF